MPYPDRPRILIVYPVVDSVAWVARLAALGVGTIQLRAKDLDDAEALQTRHRRARRDQAARATKLVVNDYWRAAIVAGAKHLHLGQEDLADADLKAIRDAGLTLGISTHDDDELATALRADPDYVALGPIFPTTLKSMRFAPQGIPKITEWKKRVGNIPLVAIGGIKFEQAAAIFAAGADFDRRRQRRHPERRSRRAGARLARTERGGRVMTITNSTAVICRSAREAIQSCRRELDCSRSLRSSQ